MLVVECCRFDGGSWNYFFVCAILLLWVPIFLRTVYSVQFCLHQCRSWPMLSYVFKMLSVVWYVRNRIKHVHPVSDGNSRCKLGAARHSTNVSCLAGPVCISSYRPTQDECARFSRSDIFYILICFKNFDFYFINHYLTVWGITVFALVFPQVPLSWLFKKLSDFFKFCIHLLIPASRDHLQSSV